MGRLTMRLPLFMLVVSGTVVAAPAVHVLHLHRRADAPIRTLTVKHRYGNVEVLGCGEGGARIEAVVRASAGTEERARLFAEAIQLDIRQDGQRLVVSTRYPRPDTSDHDLSYSVDLEVRVPRQARVEVDNSFGDLYVTGVTGGCRLANRFGEIGLDRCGPCEVTGRYGNIRMLYAEGPMQVQNAFGDVFLHQVSSRVHVDNRYGTVDAGQLEGETFIENLLGNVVARQGAGRLSIVNHMGDVSASIENEGLDLLEIVSRRGRVQLNLARGIPFSLGGRTRQGSIYPAASLDVRSVGNGDSVSGSSGTGGPTIRLNGDRSDFTIRGEDSPERR